MIKINSATKKFGSMTAVDSLNLELHDGEIFGFLGPNGAGKSTTLKMITGILSPSEGDVIVDGFSILRKPIDAKQHIGFVPDSPNIFLKLKGYEYLEFIAVVYNVPKDIAQQRIEVLSKEFGMFDSLNDIILNYSHGMRQKIIIIGVLITNPKNWILDEPMTGLDPQSAFLLKNKMHEHASKGNTVLFSTHVLEVAEKVCDRVGIINKGKLLFVGTLDELRAHQGENESLEELFLEMTK